MTDCLFSIYHMKNTFPQIQFMLATKPWINQKSGAHAHHTRALTNYVNWAWNLSKPIKLFNPTGVCFRQVSLYSFFLYTALVWIYTWKHIIFHADSSMHIIVNIMWGLGEKIKRAQRYKRAHKPKTNIMHNTKLNAKARVKNKVSSNGFLLH